MSHPDDLIELGKITGAYGLKGWVTIVPASNDPDVLLKCRQWWVSSLSSDGKPQAGPAARLKAGSSHITYKNFEVIQVKPHSDRLVAHLMGVESRELAETFKGGRVYVSRSKFPKPEQGEYYWVDLEGCQVVNQEGVDFGVVSQVVDHGAHPILSVGSHLIPFVQAFILDVDIPGKRITVDWQEDYS